MLDPTARRPRRVVARTLGFGISALVAAALLISSPAATSGWNQGSAEATLWQLLNGSRSNNGMAPLQQHATLVSLARWRSSDMLAKDYFSHTIAGCGCLVYPYYDSNGLNYLWAGENIGWNSGLSDGQSPVSVHERFMASSGHRANVLDRRFTHGGVGAAAADNKRFQGYVQNTRMYTELFMQAAGSAPAPAPAPKPAPAPAPAPAPPAGGGGGGGGGGASAPTTTVATPKAKPKPKPKAARVKMDVPQRPVSRAGIDGVAVVVSAPSVDGMIARLRVEEASAIRSAALDVTAPATSAAPAGPATAAMQVSAPAETEPGVLESIVGAVLGFLFG
jgi:uncharacterized protein YkwD